MKKVCLLLGLIASQASFAALNDSIYTTTHDKKIEEAIFLSCGKLNDLTVISTSKTEIRVDQGILDFDYKTVLTGTLRVDQGLYDSYIINVDSSYSDSYDHATSEWGSYFVNAVDCQIQY